MTNSTCTHTNATAVPFTNEDLAKLIESLEEVKDPEALVFIPEGNKTTVVKIPVSIIKKAQYLEKLEKDAQDYFSRSILPGDMTNGD